MFASKPPWGWLYAYREILPIHALKEKSYAVGVDRRNAVVITEDHVGSKVSVEQFSKLAQDPHLFKIKHKDDEVTLKSTSDCDIFINNTKVIKQKETYTLRHNDFLAIIRPEARVFVYLDNVAVEAADCPKEIKEKYVLSKKIGAGGFGIVTLIFNKKTGKKYALKKIFKRPMLQRYAETEKNILKTVDHPHVIHMEEFVEISDNLYIVLEYMEGGDLSTRIRRSSRLIESIAKFYFYQIALAVDYLHHLGIAHRDLKPENILLSSDETFSLVKVTDFGVSKAEWDTKLRTSVGTILYEAPEVIRAEKTGNAYTNKVDVWSLGVILFYCLNGKLPFDSREDILSGAFQFLPQTKAKVSDASVELVKKMLTGNTDRRLDMKSILEHRWLQDDMIRSRVSSLMKGKGAPATQAITKKEVVRQVMAPHPKPVLPVAIQDRPVVASPNPPKPTEKKAVQPRPAHAAVGGLKLPERNFLNERRPGQPRGVLRFMDGAAANDKPEAAAAAPALRPESLEAYRRIDNRKTQPFPGSVKKNVHKFDAKKP